MPRPAEQSHLERGFNYRPIIGFATVRQTCFSIVEIMNYPAASCEVSEFSVAGLDFQFPSPGVSTAGRDEVCKPGDRPVAPTLLLSAYPESSSEEFFSIKEKFIPDW